MTREEVKEMLPILQAYVDGKTIQVKYDSTWIDKPKSIITELKLNGEIKEFRIKPELKFRPFKDAEECWQEMQNHKPFGWMKFKDTECGYYILTSVAAGVGVGINDSLFSYERIFNDYTFVDGTPFGVKEEE